ncbi:ArsR/SmtB family transcription factor [Haloarcula marina]|uniref:ArsR/SmtB family transcription factor n=1 Tax=Haloarcula marina TaxID=2961574 RepID=UPI0020B880D4|nr:hypothetical protein [Halomicroarcula marina]
MTEEDDSRGRLSLDETAMGDDTSGPPPDELFKALANEKRRRVLSLLSVQGPMDLEEVTDMLVGWRATADGPTGPDEWAQVKIELVHAHLPLLSEMGLVHYDEDTDEVRLASIPDPLDDLFEFASEYERLAELYGWAED